MRVDPASGRMVLSLDEISEYLGPREIRPRKTGRVYFIEAVGANRIKIGFTHRAATKRLRELQISSPLPLREIGSIPGTLSTEGGLHKRFLPLCIGGEWFEARPVLRQHIARLLRGG